MNRRDRSARVSTQRRLRMHPARSRRTGALVRPTTLAVATGSFRAASLVALLTSLMLTACAGTFRGLVPRGPAEHVRFIEANGLEFGYLTAGHGPLVLLLHGFPDDAHTFEAILPELASEGFRAVAIFLRGYAPTDVPETGDYSIVARGWDVVELIDAFEEDCAIVVGHDWGASSAYAAASLEPWKIRKLVTVALPHARALKTFSPRQIVRARHGLVFQWAGAAKRARKDDFAYLERLYRRWSPGWEESREHFERVKPALALPGRLEAAISYYRAFFRDVFKRSSRRVSRARATVENLLVAGADDRAVVSTAFERHCNFVDDCRLRWIEGAGHFPHLEDPREFTRLLMEFLGPASEFGACRRENAGSGRLATSGEPSAEP